MSRRLRSESARAARAAVERDQRARILDATLSIASVAGYAEMSIAAILGLAGVQRRTFNAMFRGKEDAFLAAYGTLVRELTFRIARSDDPDTDPPVRVARCVATTIDYLRADPVRAEILLLEVHAVGPSAVALLQALVDRFVDGATALLAEPGVDDDLPARLRAELGVGAVHDVLRAAVFRGELDRLPALAPQLARTAFPALAAPAFAAPAPVSPTR
jgi:AcrR family transcriptional regulator